MRWMRTFRNEHPSDADEGRVGGEAQGLQGGLGVQSAPLVDGEVPGVLEALQPAP